MSYLFCLLIVVGALQSVSSELTTDIVHEVYVESVVLAYDSKMLSVTPQTRFGNPTAVAQFDATDSVEDAILKILKFGGVAQVFDPSGNYFAVPAERESSFKKGNTSRYVWSSGGTVKPKQVERSSTKIVTSATQQPKGYWKIVYLSLDFTSDPPFGNFGMTFGVVKRGMVYKEKSKHPAEDGFLFNTSFSQLKEYYQGKIFNPLFQGQILQVCPDLNRIRGEITEISVILFPGETTEKTLVINERTPAADLQKTVAWYAAEAVTSTAIKEAADLKYTFAFRYTAA